MHCSVCNGNHVKKLKCHRAVLCIGWESPRLVTEIYYSCPDCGEVFEERPAEDALEEISFDDDGIRIDPYFTDPYDLMDKVEQENKTI